MLALLLRGPRSHYSRGADKLISKPNGRLNHLRKKKICSGLSTHALCFCLFYLSKMLATPIASSAIFSTGNITSISARPALETVKCNCTLSFSSSNLS